MSNGNSRRVSFIDGARRAFWRRGSPSGLMVVAALALGAGAAVAQDGDDAVFAAYRSTYSLTIRCFVGNGILESDAKNAGRSDLAAAYEQKAARSFDLAFQAGRKIGLSDARIQSDLDGANRTELPMMMRDRAYFAKTAADCKAVGLM